MYSYNYSYSYNYYTGKYTCVWKLDIEMNKIYYDQNG